MTVLVTGAAGYVGSRLAARLVAGGEPVRGLVRGGKPLPAGVERAEGDLTRPESLKPALEGVDRVYHCAAITADRREPHRGAYDAINRGGTQNLVAAARAAGVTQLVALSGIGCRPSPAGSYMATRWGLEEAVRGSGIPFVILRPSIAFGAGSQFVEQMVKVLRGSPFAPLIGGGGLRLQPIHIDDLVTCLAEAGRLPQLEGGMHEVGGAEQLTLREMMEAICAAAHLRRPMVPLPLALMRAVAAAMAVLPNPPLTPAALGLFEFDNTCAPGAVDRLFSFHPRGFRAHLAEFGLS